MTAKPQEVLSAQGQRSSGPSGSAQRVAATLLDSDDADLTPAEIGGLMRKAGIGSVDVVASGETEVGPEHQLKRAIITQWDVLLNGSKVGYITRTPEVSAFYAHSTVNPKALVAGTFFRIRDAVYNVIWYAGIPHDKAQRMAKAAQVEESELSPFRIDHEVQDPDGTMPVLIVRAWDGAERVGVASFNVRTWVKDLHPTGVVVEPDYRRRGIATLLYNEALRLFPGYSHGKASSGAQSELGTSFRHTYDRIGVKESGLSPEETTALVQKSGILGDAVALQSTGTRGVWDVIFNGEKIGHVEHTTRGYGAHSDLANKTACCYDRIYKALTVVLIAAGVHRSDAERLAWEVPGRFTESEEDLPSPAEVVRGSVDLGFGLRSSSPKGPTVIIDNGEPAIQFHDLPDAPSISSGAWSRISQLMKQKGYDSRGGEDAKRAVLQMQRGGVLRHEDWTSVIAQVLGLKAPSQQPDDRAEGATPSVDTGTMATRVFRRAVRKWGLTDDSTLGGYILPSGRFLDMSGGSGRRAFDHREATQFLDLAQRNEFQRDRGEGMFFFQRLGAIRWMPEGPGLHLKKKPTPRQLATIERIISERPGEEIHVDVGSPKWGNVGQDYPEAVTRRIPQDILHFYRTGTLRPVSQVMNFHTHEDVARRWVRRMLESDVDPADVVKASGMFEVELLNAGNEDAFWVYDRMTGNELGTVESSEGRGWATEPDESVRWTAYDRLYNNFGEYPRKEEAAAALWRAWKKSLGESYYDSDEKRPPPYRPMLKKERRAHAKHLEQNPEEKEASEFVDTLWAGGMPPYGHTGSVAVITRRWPEFGHFYHHDQTPNPMDWGGSRDTIQYDVGYVSDKAAQSSFSASVDLGHDSDYKLYAAVKVYGRIGDKAGWDDWNGPTDRGFVLAYNRNWSTKLEEPIPTEIPEPAKTKLARKAQALIAKLRTVAKIDYVIWPKSLQPYTAESIVRVLLGEEQLELSLLPDFDPADIDIGDIAGKAGVLGARYVQIDGDYGDPWLYGGTWYSERIEQDPALWDSLIHIDGLESEDHPGEYDTWSKKVEEIFADPGHQADYQVRLAALGELDPNGHEDEDLEDEMKQAIADELNASREMTVYRTNSENDPEIKMSELETLGVTPEQWVEADSGSRWALWASYHGWHQLDDQPIRLTKAELSAKLGVDL